MLCVATCLWQPNSHSYGFSRCYDESWVEKLYRGFARNLNIPFRFVLFTDRKREFSEPIEQEWLSTTEPNYGCFTEPYRLNEPMILVGLDTVITGSLYHLANYCLRTDVEIALPRDPYARERACNGVALVPAGQKNVFEEWRGENDMDWIRTKPHDFIDDLFPGQVQSYKGFVRDQGLNGARICYFHGVPKPHELPDVPWIAEHWR